MFLIIRFKPGETLSIGGQNFTLDHDRRTLQDGQGRCHHLSDTPISPVPEVHVHVADPQRWPGMLALAFQAPRDVLLLRHRAGSGQ